METLPYTESLASPAASAPAASGKSPATMPSTEPPGEFPLSRDAYVERLRPYLDDHAVLRGTSIPEVDIPWYSEGMRANAYYFSHPQWMDIWLKYVHRYPEWCERWHAATGSLDDKVLVDIGCGPGNVLASLLASGGGTPRDAIGIDIAPGSLKMAAQQGYVPLLADTHALPMKSGFADVVTINGSLHHSDDMPRVLAEAARLVRPGGVLISDHDPQHSAWKFRGLALLMWRLRVPIYRWLGRGGHCAEQNEQVWALASEIHHRPGDGVTEALMRSTLEPLGFRVEVYPHNNLVGKAIFDGERGRAPLKMRIPQRLSGIDPSTREGAIDLFCVARRIA